MKTDIKNLNLDLFTDADFARLFATEDKQDLVSVKVELDYCLILKEYQLTGVLSYSLKYLCLH